MSCGNMDFPAVWPWAACAYVGSPAWRRGQQDTNHSLEERLDDLAKAIHDLAAISSYDRWAVLNQPSRPTSAPALRPQPSDPNPTPRAHGDERNAL